MWVALSYTPITVEVQENGSLHTFTTELGDQIAREESILGCWNCLTPLSAESYDTECSA